MRSSRDLPGNRDAEVGASPWPRVKPILTAAQASPAGVGSGPRLLATVGNRGAARTGAAAVGFLQTKGNWR